MMAGILVADGSLTGLAVDVDLYVAKAHQEMERVMTKLLQRQSTGVLLKMST